MRARPNPARPPSPHARTDEVIELLQQMGSTPYVGGGFGHFYA